MKGNANIENMERLLNREEVARLLQIAPGTLSNWTSAKRIPFVKVGRCVRFKIEDIQKWIAENTTIPNK